MLSSISDRPLTRTFANLAIRIPTALSAAWRQAFTVQEKTIDNCQLLK
jgi:hypothetical protein